MTSVLFPPLPLARLAQAALVLSMSGLRAETPAPMPAITPDVVYGHKAGMALTYDMIKPAKPNGAAVLFMVSGGWVSGWADPAPLLAKAMAGKESNAFGMLLEKGFTLFLVRHGSSPYFKVPDAVADVRRAVRHIRMQAPANGLNPDRLGVFGGSAGGHLSLMLGTTSDAGKPTAADPVEKVSNRVAAVTAYFPPTDLNGYIDDKRFPALHFPKEQADAVSPLKHVSADDAPSLLVHGMKDTLVTPSHSENILAAFRKEGVPSDLITFPEAGHGFGGADEKAASTALTAWFEKYLLTKIEPSKTAAPAKGSIAGSWTTQAALPDGNVRPGTLLLQNDNNKWTATAKGDGGEVQISRVAWENDRLEMEFDMVRDGFAGVIRVEAKGPTEGPLKGRWTVEDDQGKEMGGGDWSATRSVTP